MLKQWRLSTHRLKNSIFSILRNYVFTTSLTNSRKTTLVVWISIKILCVQCYMERYVRLKYDYEPYCLRWDIAKTKWVSFLTLRSLRLIIQYQAIFSLRQLPARKSKFWWCHFVKKNVVFNFSKYFWRNCNQLFREKRKKQKNRRKSKNIFINFSIKEASKIELVVIFGLLIQFLIEWTIQYYNLS